MDCPFRDDCSRSGRRHPHQSNLVKVFTKKEWNELNGRIHADGILAAQFQKQMQSREKIKEKSYEIHKEWTNTILGMRRKKLIEREERLRKEEEERIAIDLEWAKFKARERVSKLCAARTALLYMTPCFRNFHEALRLGDALKENELQLKLKEMKRRDDIERSKAEFQAMMNSIVEAENKEKRCVEEKRNAELEIRKFQCLQSEERYRQKEEEKLALRAEGQEIRRLAKEAEKLKQDARKDLLKTRKMTRDDLLQEIETTKRRHMLERLRDEEEDQKNRDYAVAKCQECKMKMEEEQAVAAEKASLRQRLSDYLSNVIVQQEADREASMEIAAKQEEERWNQRLEKEAKMREDSLEATLTQRAAAVQAEKERKARQAEEEKAERQRLINLDEATRREDAERRAESIRAAKELAQHYREEIIRHEELRRKEREADDWAANMTRRIAKQNDVFQKYAKRVIETCEQTGIPTFAMRKAAQDKRIGEGFQINIIADIEESMAKTNDECIDLPPIPPHKENLSL